jgi:ribosomal protein S18 acetylase RimI-like enzyme
MGKAIKIVDYRPEHQPYFESFNRSWIEKLFTMEPVDEFVLTDPEEAILKSGGAIIMAEYKGAVAGTVGLRKVDAFTYEFTKMAVDEKFRRLGIAEAICFASFKKAKQLGAKRVILYSNTLNAGAIKLYEKIGFRHVPVEPGVYKRANVKMVIDMEAALRVAKEYDRRESPNLKIAEAGVSQVAHIASIGKKSFRHAFGHLFLNRDELLGYLEFTYDPVKLMNSVKKANNIYLLAYAGGIPAGFAKLKNHSLNEFIESPVQMELQKIYVLPEYQGAGVGDALMQEIKNIVNGIHPDHLWLDTHVSNEKAIRFYSKHGFQKVGNYFFTIGTQNFEYYVMGLLITGVTKTMVGKDLGLQKL